MEDSLSNMAKHFDCIVQFSGGKDSLAALHIARSKWNRLICFYGDTGGFYPHMVKFVWETCKKLAVPLYVCKPNISLYRYHESVGYPSDIVPVERSVDMKPYNNHSGISLQSPLRCCSMMQWMPLDKAVRASGIKHVVRGSKKSDQHVGMGDGYVDRDGITYHCPVWDWSDAAVFDYLKQLEVEIAPHYEEVNNSFDCILCTAFLRSDGAKGRLEYTKKHYPEYMPELKRRVNLVRSVIREEHEAVMDVMSVIEEEKVNG